MKFIINIFYIYRATCSAVSHVCKFQSLIGKDYIFTQIFFLQKDKAIKKMIFAFSWKTSLAIITLYPQSFTYILSILTTKNFTVVQISFNITAVLRLKLKLWMKQVDFKILTLRNMKSCFHCTSEQWEIIGVSPIICQVQDKKPSELQIARFGWIYHPIENPSI